MKDLSIVIPVYYGEKSISKVVDSLIDNIQGIDFEIVLVNDGSKDNSSEEIHKLSQKYSQVLSFDLMKNFGEHNAVLAGYSKCSGRYIINIDDDFQNPPYEVVNLFNYASTNQHFDVVYTYYDQKKHHFLRNIGSKFNDYCAQVLINKPKGLYLSSFRCIHFEVKDELLKYQGPYPYIDGQILNITQHIGTFKVDHFERDNGESNYTFRRLVRLWLNVFFNFSVMPLRIASVVGFVITIISLIFIVQISIDFLIHKSNPTGWTSLFVAITFFAGAQLVTLGLIGEYLGRIFITTNKKQQFVIRNNQSQK